MAATSICQKFNLKLIALLCCCHHDCSCYTLFIAAGQHLQHIFQMPSSYFAHAGGIRIQEGRGGSSPNYSHALRWIKHIPSTRIFWIAVQVDSATRPEIMFASPNYSNRCCGKCPGRGGGQAEREAQVEMETQHMLASTVAVNTSNFKG